MIHGVISCLLIVVQVVGLAVLLIRRSNRREKREREKLLTHGGTNAI